MKRYEEMARHELYDTIDRLMFTNNSLQNKVNEAVEDIKKLRQELKYANMALRKERMSNFKPRYRTDY